VLLFENKFYICSIINVNQIKMKIKFKNLSGVTYAHLKNVASTDALRPVMNGVNINFKENRLECTDAHLLMIYPINILSDSEFNEDVNSVIVPIRFFNHLKYMIDIHKKHLESIDYVLLDEYAEVYFAGELVYRCKYIEGKYPIVSEVISNIQSKRKEVKEIGFNLGILSRLTKAFPYKHLNNVKFSLYAQNKGMLVESLNEDLLEVKGIVMPIMLT